MSTNNKLELPIQKEHGDKTFLAFTILFAVILLIAVGFIIYFAYQQATLPPRQPRQPENRPTQFMLLNANIGGVNYSIENIDSNINTKTKNQCDTIQNAYWDNNDNICKCNDAFFGDNCEREKHHNKYYAVGIPEGDFIELSDDNEILQEEPLIKIQALDEMVSNGKSFNNNDNTNTCSNNCDNTENCVGFIFNNNICTLLQNNVVVSSKADINYSSDKDSFLYLRSSDNLDFIDRIFIGAYAFSFPPRYWLMKQSPDYIQLSPNIVSEINFIPTYTKIYGSYIGIYCLHTFTIDDVPILLSRDNTDNCYIHYSSEQINIPKDWTHNLPLYVMYIKSEN